jgi:hypothetical protein
MSKSFTCRELGGICNKVFSGNSVMEIMEQAGPHMMSNAEHKKSIMSLEARTGETKMQWIKRIERQFEAKPENS